MPVFHDETRANLRRMYFEAWRKHREALPVQPLEDQIIRVVELHPEYHAVLEGGSETLERDYAPDEGQSNPFLHLGMHLAIREQVGTDRPPGIRAVHSALAARLGGVHDAEHEMIECLGEALWNAQRAGVAPDEQRYLEELRRRATTR